MMKDEDIKLPARMPDRGIGGYSGESLLSFAREAVRMNRGHESSQASAWREFADAMSKYNPDWLKDTSKSPLDLAIEFIKPKAAVEEPLPFDLEAAKRGEPLVTWDGRRARFVAHVPEVDDGHRVIVVIDGNSKATAYNDNGRSRFGKALDLFLAPKPKRTVWVNFYKDGEARWSTDKDLAERGYDASMGGKLGRAVPIQIDDVGGEG